MTPEATMPNNEPERAPSRFDSLPLTLKLALCAAGASVVFLLAGVLDHHVSLTGVYDAWSGCAAVLALVSFMQHRFGPLVLYVVAGVLLSMLGTGAL